MDVPLIPGTPHSYIGSMHEEYLEGIYTAVIATLAILLLFSICTCLCCCCCKVFCAGLREHVKELSTPIRKCLRKRAVYQAVQARSTPKDSTDHPRTNTSRVVATHSYSSVALSTPKPKPRPKRRPKAKPEAVAFGQLSLQDFVDQGLVDTGSSQNLIGTDHQVHRLELFQGSPQRID